MTGNLLRVFFIMLLTISLLSTHTVAQAGEVAATRATVAESTGSPAGGNGATTPDENAFLQDEAISSEAELDPFAFFALLAALQGMEGEASDDWLEQGFPESATGLSSDAFTPEGQGTVIDNAFAAGKEFFTIATALENTFYLVIDRERSSNNVYFLRAVQEADLIDFVAELPELPEAQAEGKEEAVPQPATQPTDAPEEPTEPEVEVETKPDVKQIALLVVLGVILLAGAIIGIVILRRPRMQPINPEIADWDSYDDQEEDLTDNDDDYIDQEGD